MSPIASNHSDEILRMGVDTLTLIIIMLKWYPKTVQVVKLWQN
ncbi:hypothetical protein BCL69_11234 [Nitrosomonas communis]|uniref:Uncharacterized protein n=1 Tax=Nitrosomonas communis TaxID=44574 RepID=A0A5D3Y6E4_9PROT|nr:hypothetical protein BCL69_11234 [Nitrosomonas communis]